MTKWVARPNKKKETTMNATVKQVWNDHVEIAWEPAEGAEKYHVYCLKEGNACAALFKGSSCKGWN